MARNRDEKTPTLHLGSDGSKKNSKITTTNLPFIKIKDTQQDPTQRKRTNVTHSSNIKQYIKSQDRQYTPKAFTPKKKPSEAKSSHTINIVTPRPSANNIQSNSVKSISNKRKISVISSSESSDSSCSDSDCSYKSCKTKNKKVVVKSVVKIIDPLLATQAPCIDTELLLKDLQCSEDDQCSISEPIPDVINKSVIMSSDSSQVVKADIVKLTKERDILSINASDVPPSKATTVLFPDSEDMIQPYVPMLINNHLRDNSTYTPTPKGELNRNRTVRLQHILCDLYRVVNNLHQPTGTAMRESLIREGLMRENLRK